MGLYTPILPWALRREVGTFVIALMTAALVILIYFKIYELRLGGLF
jgi:hypothetical protein